MSKGILIVDMPDSCFNCNFHNYHFCYAVQCSNEDGDCVEKYLNDEVPGKTKPDWCPLKELPEYSSKKYLVPKLYADGFNECLKAIIGDERNLSSEGK